MVTTIISVVEDIYNWHVWNQRLFKTVKTSITGTSETNGVNGYFRLWKQRLLARLKPTITMLIIDAEDNDYWHVWNQGFQRLFETSKTLIL